MSFIEGELEYSRRKEKALSMGGPQKLQQRKEMGILNARERVAHLIDADTWEESGLFGTAVDLSMRDATPTDGKIVGFGQVNGRDVGVLAYDFTVKGSSSAPTSEKKSGHVKKVCRSRGLPLIVLGESTGVRMPDILGGTGMGGMNGNETRFLRQRETPWASAILGYAFGSAAWHACAADFNVMRKGATMAVSSPGLVSMATKAQVDPETLGGWKLHSEVTGFADMVVNSDEEAIGAIKRFLSYLPSHCMESPPVGEVPDGSDEPVKGILDLIPESRNKVYDMRKVIQAIVDTDSLFELKARFAKSLVTGLARIDGRTVGIIANNPQFKGGAIDADACDKATSMIVLCDSFNIPIVFLVDQPGFLIGVEVERQGMIGKVINWMNALSLCTVPKISIILRKSYGQAFINMGAGGPADEVAVWWTGEISFMDPAAAVHVVHGIKEEDDPQRYHELLEEMQKSTSPYDFAAVYGAHTLLDPRETRDYLKRMINIYQARLSNGVGQHLLCNWPTSYR